MNDLKVRQKEWRFKSDTWVWLSGIVFIVGSFSTP